MFLLTAAVIASATCGGGQRPATDSKPRVRLAVPALDGGEIAVQQHRGEPVILHFFTTGDLGTQADADRLEALHQERGDELIIIGIAMDADGYAVVAPWRNAMGLHYLVGLATPEIRAGKSALGPIPQVPTTIVLDRQGRIAARIDRPLGSGELESALAKLR